MENKANNETAPRRGFWNFIDSIKGDKVVWIIVFMLVMFSILAVFSSTSLLAMGDSLDRLEIAREQIIIAAVGLGVIWLICRIKRIEVFRILSQFGFLISFILLLILDLHINLGFCRPIETNGVYRALSVFGFQVHVFEVVKVTMIMYIAWAIESFKKDQEAIKTGENTDTFTFANALAKNDRLSFLSKPISKRLIYMYLPIMIICVMIMPGSNSSAIFVGGILIATLLIGGIPLREIALATVACLIGLLIIIGIYKVSDGEMFGRVGTFLSRIEAEYDPIILEEDGIVEGSTEFRKRLDRIQQPFGAKVAIHEGGFFGKGSGNSTQKYVVAVMYGDYMFSFIIEEYGIWGAILIIMLYVSLLARGSFIAQLCESEFGKVAVGGLSLLITGQAFMHMAVNIDIGIMTGQTLPLVSHGSSAFLMFSMAFGVILSISRMTRKRIKKEEDAVTPIYRRKEDELQATLEDIERLEDLQ